MEKVLCKVEGTEVRMGDYVGFKDGVEESGRVEGFENGQLVVSCWDGEAGEYYERRKAPSRCWFEAPGAQTIADTKKAREASIAAMAQQAMVGNAMIEAGNNSTVDHIKAAEAQVISAKEGEMVDAPEGTMVDFAAETATSSDALWAATYSGARTSGLSKTAALRATAAGWKGSRKEFLTAAEKYGLNSGTAARQWQEGRK
jgi:hypothetical protein